MAILVYRLLCLFLLFVFGADTLNRFVAVSSIGEVGRYAFIAVNALFFLLILITGLRHGISPKIVWGTTLMWCVSSSWWSWIERQSSLFILHELHTFDPDEARPRFATSGFTLCPASAFSWLGSPASLF